MLTKFQPYLPSRKSSILLIGVNTALIAAFKEAGYSLTIFDYENQTTPVDIRAPWPTPQKLFSLIISNLWPAEESGQQEFLRRARKQLHPCGQLLLIRPGFEKDFSFAELPAEPPQNNWLLTSTLTPELPLPRELQLNILNLTDSYPWKERFLVNIMECLCQKTGLALNWQTAAQADKITLTATGTLAIGLRLDLTERSFSATVKPAQAEAFKILSRLAVATFCNDIERHETARTATCQITTIVAK